MTLSKIFGNSAREHGEGSNFCCFPEGLSKLPIESMYGPVWHIFLHFFDFVWYIYVNIPYMHPMGYDLANSLEQIQAMVILGE